MPYIVKIGDKEFKIELEKEAKTGRCGSPDPHNFKVHIDGKVVKVKIIEDRPLFILVDNKPYDIIVGEVQEHRPQPQDEKTIYVSGEPFCVEVRDEKTQMMAQLKREIRHIKEIKVTAPMPGLIIQVEVQEGDKVKTGQGLAIVEAMKMQNEIKAPRDGMIKQIIIKKGMTVNAGDGLVVIE